MVKSKNGFTIVELLIVIVVIAILASISVVAYSGITTRSQASAIASDLRATEKALRLYKEIAGGGNWIRDNSPLLANKSNPYIHEIISAQPEFNKLLSTQPTIEGLNTGDPVNVWFYDYDGDTFAGGCGFSNTGANLVINYVSNLDLLREVDAILDDGDLNCGRAHGGSYNFFYNID